MFHLSDNRCPYYELVLVYSNTNQNENFLQSSMVQMYTLDGILLMSRFIFRVDPKRRRRRHWKMCIVWPCFMWCGQFVSILLMRRNYFCFFFMSKRKKNNFNIFFFTQPKKKVTTTINITSLHLHLHKITNKIKILPYLNVNTLGIFFYGKIVFN